MTQSNFAHGVPVAALANLTELGTPQEEIKWREGPKGTQLAYVDARYVMRVLDSGLIGPENWQRVHAIGSDGRIACGIGIRVNYGTDEDPANEWLWKWDGAGETDIEGEKGSFSDSFKRAAVSWGIARDLYAMKPGQRAEAYPAKADIRPVLAPHQDDLVAGLDEEAAEASCPYHGKPWRNGAYGWFCSGKGGNGPINKKGYCDAKPDKAWQARREVAA